MKKTFTLLAALVLSCTLATAQEAVMKTVEGGVAKSRAVQPLMPKAKATTVTPTTRFDLATGEHIMGYYDTDDLPETALEYNMYLGLTTYPGTWKAGSCFETQVCEKFVGGEITKIRFAVADAETQVNNIYICELSPNYSFSTYSPVIEVDLSDYTTQAGWNEVDLPTSVPVNANKYYMIGYEYVQTSSNYPLVTDYELDTDYSSTYGFFIYGALTTYYGTDWYYFNSYGQLCIQAVVKGGNFIDNDLTLKDLSVNKYVQANGELGYSVKVKNYGNQDVTSYKLCVEIDGEVVQTLDTPVALTAAYQTVKSSYTMPATTTTGSHTFKVYVSEINGATPTENVDDDSLEGSFTVYEGGVDRQKHLIEQFTSIYCGYCPRAHTIIEKMQELYPNKYTCAAIHGSGMGDDPYYLSSGYTDYIEYWIGQSTLYQSYPTAGFNRYILSDTDLNPYGVAGLSMGYSASYATIVAEWIDEVLEDDYATIPAFVSVDIDAQYDQSSRLLTFTVSGSGAAQASTMLDGNVLTVYITESNIAGTQEDYDNGKAANSYFIDFTHANVVRAIATAYYGDDIEWTSTSSYSNTYAIDIDEEWDPENINIVAFISGPMIYISGGYGYWEEPENGYVNNANDFQLSNAAGISTTFTDNTLATVVARYTADGQRLSKATKGLNIVKMSDGTARKVIVK